MAEFKKDPNERGVLWIKDGPRGVYMTGIIDDQPVVVFAANKKSEKSPDWRVLKSQPKGERSATPKREEPPTPDDDDFGS